MPLSPHHWDEKQGQPAVEVHFFWAAFNLEVIDKDLLGTIDVNWIFSPGLAVISGSANGHDIKLVIDRLKAKGISNDAWYVGENPMLHLSHWQAERLPVPWLRIKERGSKMWVSHTNQ